MLPIGESVGGANESSETVPDAFKVYEINLDELPETPWRSPGVDISDYFNYGFNEQMWKEYASMVRTIGKCAALNEVFYSLYKKKLLIFFI